MKTGEQGIVIAVVGPCAAGKSTLIRNLQKVGIVARHVAQEHSYVASMWKRITNPDVLIYLDVSYPATLRRKRLNWTEEEYKEELFRLRDARTNANLYLMTDPFTEQEILEKILDFLYRSFPLLRPQQ
jgi:deoxyadenosine/deoxycytidine kinase